MMCHDWRWRNLLATVLWLALANFVAANPSDQVQTEIAGDTLGPLEDRLEDATACLSGFQWERAAFEVESRPVTGEDFDQLVRFP